MDFIVTGASRGIGRALAEQLAARPATRVFAVARDAQRLAELASSRPHGAVVAVAADLSRVADARAAGRTLAERIEAGAVLIHNAGIWPSKKTLVDGVESAFATNCLAPLALQEPLLEARKLARVLVISAGLLVRGRFDPAKTPVGADFSSFRTYCSTKLAGAAAMRDAARAHPGVDFAIIHPGVVNTDLGARGGLLGFILRRVKRSWESPSTCAARLVRVLDRPRWSSTAGDAAWLFEEEEQPWPAEVERDVDAVRAAVRAALRDAAAP